MGYNLEKNETFNLTKDSDNLQRIRAVLSWTTPSNIFPKYDLDVSAFMLGSDGKLIDKGGFIYFNNSSSPDNSVWMGEDEREGGQEELFIDIEKLSDAVKEISILVTIHKAEQRGHSFDKVSDSKIQIFNDVTGDIIATFNLNGVDKGSTAVHVGTFYQQGDEFSFHALGQPYKLQLRDFVDGYTN